ncbi:MAG: hypothetical protein QXQ40_00650 [Candidatus Aenigmatarchaeota archaeon]
MLKVMKRFLRPKRLTRNLEHMEYSPSRDVWRYLASKVDDHEILR